MVHKLPLRRVLQVLEYTGALGFIAFLSIVFLIIVYALITGIDFFRLLESEGLTWFILLQGGGWLFLALSPAVILKIFERFEGEEPKIEATTEFQVKIPLYALAIIGIIFVIVTLTTIKATVWSLLTSLPPLIAFGFMVMEALSLAGEI